jgi:uncharacterized small protein (DUF1192 family)
MIITMSCNFQRSVSNTISFTRHFCQYQKLLSVEEITQEIVVLDAETERMLREVLGV